MTLPYKVPDNDLSLNLGVILITIDILGMTSRKKLLLNSERLRLCLHLLKNPLVLNEILVFYEKPPARLQTHDEYSIASISQNFDTLHDGHQLRILLQYASASNLISVEYRKADGFMFLLSGAGKNLANKLEGEYFRHLRSFAIALTQLNSVPTSSLNEIVDNKRWRKF